MADKIQIEQGTPEWHKLRQVSIGGSDCPVIMGVDPFRSAHTLWKEKLLGTVTPPTPAMLEGHLLEPVARQMFEDMSGLRFPSAVFRHSTHPWMIASLDGWSEDARDGLILEIKTVSEKKFASITEPTPAWNYQIQHQMFVTGARQAVLLVMSRADEPDFKLFDVLKNPMDQDLLFANESIFYRDSILGWKPPELLITPPQ